MHRTHSRLIHGVPGRECQHLHKKLLLFLGAFNNPYIYEVYRDNLMIKTLLLIISFLSEYVLLNTCNFGKDLWWVQNTNLVT